MKTLRALLLIVGAIGIFILFAALDFLAFREKFHDAAWWAWFFSHR